MADLFDLFDDGPELAAQNEAMRQIVEVAQAPPPPPDLKVVGPGLPRLRADEPCPRPANRSTYLCRVGGGDAGLSDDGGRTWFCSAHRPPDFFPSDRGKGGEGLA